MECATVLCKCFHGMSAEVEKLIRLMEDADAEDEEEGTVADEEIVFSVMKSLEEDISCCGCTTTENAASVADEIRSRDMGDEISCLLRGWEDEPAGMRSTPS
ncbi:hypothetical protein KI387_027520, partial [Taxus chinensis]